MLRSECNRRIEFDQRLVEAAFTYRNTSSEFREIDRRRFKAT
jgi:hypothetical protein